MAASYLALAYDMIGGPIDSSFGPKRRSIEDAISDLGPEDLVAARSEEGAPVAVGRTKSGRIVVIQDTCPHDGGLLSTGFIEGERIVCARHGWEFEVDGATCAQSSSCPQNIRRQ